MGDGTVVQFPPLMKNQSLARKLAIERQSQAMLTWFRWMVSVDRKVVEGAEELGITEEQFRPYVYAAMQRQGKMR
jgi:hypothetical protein